LALLCLGFRSEYTEYETNKEIVLKYASTFSMLVPSVLIL